MTQDEVDLIYAYLHENYEYRDGDLILKRARGNRKKGQTAGTFFMGSRGKPVLEMSVTLNKIYYNLYLSSAIYLYHYREYFKYISFKDLNCTNTNIDNLSPSCVNGIKKEVSTKCKGTKLTKRNGSIFYRAVITRDGKEMHLGLYRKQSEAHDVYIYASDVISKNLSINLMDLKSSIKNKFPQSNLRIKNKMPAGVKDRGNKFQAYVYLKNDKKFKQKSIGFYNTPEEAHAAYLKAKEEYKNAQG